MWHGVKAATLLFQETIIIFNQEFRIIIFENPKKFLSFASLKREYYQLYKSCQEVGVNYLAEHV